ncbi:MULTISPECIES: hypothetical protein [Aeromonas]|uniref:hypothetical protein n=3 Tax=Aeromonas caviae TaxID=648 RepID=UPI0029D9F558|nr:hypothetical protein [Aeromonas caviae]MDX7805794.1 hypothetical protein [Aeromonas caviae]
MGFLEIFVTSLGGTATAVAILGYLGRGLLDNRLKKDFEDHKLLMNEALSIKATVNRYSRVVMIAAEDIQDRLWHLCERQAASKNKVLEAQEDSKPMYGSWPMTKQHYLLGTMYLISRYLCWVEILKERVRFLEFNDDEKTKLFYYHLKRIERMLADTSLHDYSENRISTDKPVFQLMQSEIGQYLMKENGGELSCIGFPEFKKNYNKLKESSDAISRLEELLYGSMSSAKSNFCLTRLKLLGNSLMDLVKFLHEHNQLEEAEGLEKLTIQDFNIDKYHEKWPVKPNKAMQLTAFGGS